MCYLQFIQCGVHYIIWLIRWLMLSFVSGCLVERQDYVQGVAIVTYTAIIQIVYSYQQYSWSYYNNCTVIKQWVLQSLTEILSDDFTKYVRYEFQIIWKGSPIYTIVNPAEQTTRSRRCCYFVQGYEVTARKVDCASPNLACVPLTIIFVLS